MYATCSSSVCSHPAKDRAFSQNIERCPTTSTRKLLAQGSAGYGKPIGEQLQTNCNARLPFVDLDCPDAVESMTKNIAERCGYMEPSERPTMDEVSGSKRRGGTETVRGGVLKQRDRTKRFAWMCICGHQVPGYTKISSGFYTVAESCDPLCPLAITTTMLIGPQDIRRSAITTPAPCPRPDNIDPSIRSFFLPSPY